MMTFGYETKNKEVKTYANISNQRKNLPYSLSTKAAMRFNEFLRNHKEGFQKETSHKVASKINWCEFKKQNDFDFVNALKPSQEFVYKMQIIFHKKTKYKIDDFIVDSIECPQKLMRIDNMLLIDDEYFLIAELFAIECFDKHFRSYKVGEKTNTFELIKVKDLFSLPFNLNKISNGNTYFRLKNI